jgi:hypothetical protein
MNEGTGSSRGLSRRTCALAAAVAGITLLVAACGGGGSSVAAGPAAYQKAAAFAHCMRSHGALSWPDPNSQGIFVSDKATRADFRAPASANKACQYLDTGAPMTAAQQRQATTQALKFAECMRSHGIPHWPDPAVNANGVVFNGTGGAGRGSPLLRSAQQACRSLLPAPRPGS